MHKRILSLFLTLLIVFSLSACAEELTIISSDSPAGGNASDVPYSSDVTSSEDENKPDIDSWELRLVNKWNTISDAGAPELVKISETYAWANDKRFDARAIDAVTALCEAAHKDGAKLYIISAYRTDATQQRLFNNEVNAVMRDNPSLTKEQAEVRAATEVARPGTSEHQLGLAVDFNSVEQNFEDTKEFAWLQAHAHEYGFIMRYPKDKQDITAVIYEPWHYRYVGVENAKLIKESGLCLEEFVEQYK